MPRNNPIFRQVNNTDAEINRLSDTVIRAYNRFTRRGLSPEMATLAALQAVNMEPALINIIVPTAIDILAKRGGLEIADYPGAREWYLNRVWRGQDLNLSQTIHNATVKANAEIISAVRVRMRLSKSWQSIAKGIEGVGVTSGELPGYIKSLESAARAALKGDQVAMREYRRTLRVAQSRIDKLAQAGAPTQRLKSAYQNLVAKTQSLDAQAIDRAIDRAVRAKINYNAQRVSRTELARAYGLGEGERIEQDLDVEGVRLVLSSRHEIFDICDIMAGDYPKNQVPTYPHHPHCLCVIERVYTPNKDTRRFSKSTVQNKLSSLSNSKLAQVLGKKGADQYRRNPSTWTRNLRNYTGVRPLTGVDGIPKKFIK